MRFLQRNVQQAVQTHLETGLLALKWTGSAINFGEDPVVFIEDERTEGKPHAVSHNSVALTVDQQGRDRLQELGGPLREVEVMFICDVYGSRPSIAVSIAGDIIDLVNEKTLVVKDLSLVTPVDTGVRVELESPTMTRPLGDVNAIEFKMAWRVVSFYGMVSYG